MKLRKLKMNKKGDFQSLIIMIAIVFILALAVIIFSKVFLLFTSELKDTGEFSNRSIEKIEIVEDNTIPLLDFFIFFTLISLMIGLIISSIYIDTHPALTIIFLIAIIIAVFIAGQLANVYTDIVGHSELASTASEFVYTDALFSNFAMVILVVGIIIAIILFGKTRKVEI